MRPAVTACSPVLDGPVAPAYAVGVLPAVAVLMRLVPRAPHGQRVPLDHQRPAQLEKGPQLNA
jgi:hypothetical protein